MKLYHTSTSPFVRKVLVAAHELGLDGRIETAFLRPTPVAPNPELSRANPLSKIPALILNDGSGLYDSRVICEYLETLREPGVPALVAPSGPERFRTLRLQALCDGILEAAILVFYERAMRPPALHWEEWLSGQTQKALQGLDALELECEHFGETPDLAQIAAGVTLGWLEFRSAVGDIRAGRPRLTSWYERFSQRSSMLATLPVG